MVNESIFGTTTYFTGGLKPLDLWTWLSCHVQRLIQQIWTTRNSVTGLQWTVIILPVIKGIIKSSKSNKQKRWSKPLQLLILQQALEVWCCKILGDSRRLPPNPWISSRTWKGWWNRPKARPDCKIPRKTMWMDLREFGVPNISLGGKYIIPNSKLLPQYHFFFVLIVQQESTES